MSIDFSLERWSKVRETYRLWWEGKLNRPIVPVILDGREVGRHKPDIPLLTQATCPDFSIPAEYIINRIDFELSTKIFLGDAFPFLNLIEYGPGVVDGFLGTKMDNSSGRVWFKPKEHIPITEMHFEYDPDNKLLHRIKDICSEGIKRWQGEVLIGMPDLGGVLDILATFRSTEGLLMDLYDYPEDVKRLTWEIYELWHRYYNEINEVLQPVNPGYSDWSTIYSDKPSYVPQSDFGYMIGSDMFEEFVRPELEATFKRLPRSIYHLDGVGQLEHLDSLLKIKELDVVQWIPGDGKPDQSCWPDVYKKIKDAGKKIQLTDYYNSFQCLDAVIKQLGTGCGIQFINIYKSVSEENEVFKQLLKYGIE